MQGAPPKAKGGEKKDAPAEVKSTGYQRRESDRAKSARLSSWSHQHSTEISEPFLNLSVQVAPPPCPCASSPGRRSQNEHPG